MCSTSANLAEFGTMRQPAATSSPVNRSDRFSSMSSLLESNVNTSDRRWRSSCCFAELWCASVSLPGESGSTPSSSLNTPCATLRPTMLYQRLASHGTFNVAEHDPTTLAVAEPHNV